MFPRKQKPSALVLTKPPRLQLRRGRWRWEPRAKEVSATVRSCYLDDVVGHPVTNQYDAWRIAAMLNEQLATTGVAPQVLNGVAVDVVIAREKIAADDRSFGALIALYKAAPVFYTKKRGGGRRAKRYIDDIVALCNRLLTMYPADFPVADFDTDEIETRFQKFQSEEGKVTEGKNRLKMLRELLNFAVRKKWVLSNPAIGVIGIASGKGRADVIFEHAEQLAFRGAAILAKVPCQWSAFVLGLTTTQNIGDLLKQPKMVLDKEANFFVMKPRDKTGITPFAPAPKVLLDELEAMATRALHFKEPCERLLVRAKTGKPYNYTKFNLIFRAVRALAAGDLATYAEVRETKHARFLPEITTLDGCGFIPTPSIADKHFNDTRGTGLTQYLDHTDSMMVTSLIAAHTASGKEEKDIKNPVMLKHYYKKQGKKVAKSNAATAWADLEAAIDPKNKFRVVKDK